MTPYFGCTDNLRDNVRGSGIQLVSLAHPRAGKTCASPTTTGSGYFSNDEVTDPGHHVSGIKLLDPERGRRAPPAQRSRPAAHRRAKPRVGCRNSAAHPNPANLQEDRINAPHGVAMQKVVGSSPIIRSQKAPLGGFFVACRSNGRIDFGLKGVKTRISR